MLRISKKLRRLLDKWGSGVLFEALISLEGQSYTGGDPEGVMRHLLVGNEFYLTVPDGKFFYIANYRVDSIPNPSDIEITGLRRVKGLKRLKL